MDGFWTAPPVSRTLTALTLCTSLLVYGRIMSAYHIFFSVPLIFKLPLPEPWRFFTAFWLTGKDLSILFDTYFMWTYSSGLERDSGRFTQPGDFFTYTLFVGSVIVATAGLILGSPIFTHALIMAFAYTYSQDNKGQKVSFFVVSFNVMWLPYAMLMMTFIMNGPDAALTQAMGLLAAHLYDFLTRLYPTFGGGRNYIQTPYLFKRWFGGETSGVEAKKYGTAFRPAVARPESRSTGSAFSNAWSTRGQGQRLGGD